jgi:anthranilate phosphoribosyltransferase
LQIPITFEKDALRTYYAQHKFIFLFAPQFHPAMKYAVPVRKQLGVRTIFNVLGPITNPAGPTKQMIGVFSPQFLPEYAQAVARLGYERILLYSAENGMDEVSATHPTLIYDVRGSEITQYTLNPEEFFSAIELSSLPQNCTAEENAAIFMETIDSQIPSPLSKMLALNTALALEILEEKGELQQDYKTALDFIHSGEVLQRVQGLKKG